MLLLCCLLASDLKNFFSYESMYKNFTHTRYDSVLYLVKYLILKYDPESKLDNLNTFHC